MSKVSSSAQKNGWCFPLKFHCFIPHYNWKCCGSPMQQPVFERKKWAERELRQGRIFQAWKRIGQMQNVQWCGWALRKPMEPELSQKRSQRHWQETQAWCKVKALGSFKTEYDISWEGRKLFNTHTLSLISFTQTLYLGIPLSVRLESSL